VKKKLPIILVVALVAVGGLYKTVLAKPAEETAKPKVEGTVYILEKEFLVNLADGAYAKLSVGFVMEHGDTSTVAADAGGHGGTTAPEGYGTMPQEAIVRDLITDSLTNASQHELIQSEGREEIKKKILKALRKNTDVHPEEVLFMDVTVQ
jgi:flagellar basal body-associated protein FliL